MRFSRTTLSAIVVAFTLTSTGLGAGAAGEPYKIGMTYPLTGPLAPLAVENLIGANIAVDEINRAGGIHGHPLQLVTEDTLGTPQGGVAATRKLVQVDHVLAIESVYTNIVTAQLPLVDQLQVPLCTTTEAPGLFLNSQYAFSHASTFGQNLPHLEKYWRAKNVKRIFGFLTNNALGQQQSGFMKQIAQSMGATYAESLLDPNSTDFRGQVARAQEFKPDAIVITGQGAPYEATAVRQTRESGVTATVYSLSNGWASKSFRDILSSYAEGMIFGGIALDPLKSGKYMATYRAKAGFTAAFTSAEVYDCIKIIAYGLGKSDGRSGEPLRAAMANLKDFPSIMGGTISMGPDRQTRIGSVGLWQVVHLEERPIPGY